FLGRAGMLQHEASPLDVQRVRYLDNSAVVPQIKEGDKSQDNPATKGIGLEATAGERPIVTGTDAEQPVDAPSAYVTLKEKGSGQSLGTYLVSDHLHPQPVLVNGKTYELSLRFKRTYKPYSLYLSKFSNDRYLG